MWVARLLPALMDLQVRELAMGQAFPGPAPTTPGLEFTLPENRMHFDFDEEN